MKYVPSLDKNFKPMILFLNEFNKRVNEEGNKQLITIYLERNDGYNYIYSLNTFKDNTSHDEENYDVVERIIKSLLWIVGGYKILIAGSKMIANRIINDYTENGKRSFDANFMKNVYGDFIVKEVNENEIPKLKEEKIIINDDISGCRIGFDAGGSDRKVSAVIDGEAVYSEEVIWYPKLNEDPEYHYNGILESFKKAASFMPRVDAIGVSSAGIYVNNEIKVASLFLKVSEEDFKNRVCDMYIRAAKEIGDVPLVVSNDGDVSALAGAMELNSNEVLGIAMGTSEAAGYVDEDNNLKGWLNELAFVPVDASKDAMVDEWSGDYGCGVKYFSQDGVIKLALNGGIELDEELPLAQKLKYIQKLNEEGNEIANQVFESIGIYLGYTLAYYSLFYKIKNVLLLGRVVSGKGGNTILAKAKEVLKDEFEYLNINISMPDEKNRRVGQSIAAAKLPRLK